MDDLVEQRRARLAWRGATIAAALNLFGSPVELLIGRSVPDMPRWPPLAAAGVGLLLLLYLLAMRDGPTRRGAAIAFLVNTATVASFLYFTNSYFAQLGARWAPFQANKLGALTVGLLMPELWVGSLSIAMYGLGALVQWLLFPAALKAQLVVGEPWAMLIISAFGVVLLVQGARRFAVERQMLQTEHEAQAAERLARAFLAVRDFANTPLQVIDSAAALLRLRQPETGSELALIERAVSRMRELNRLLSRYERDLRWTKEDESFDALSVLAAEGGKPCA